MRSCANMAQILPRGRFPNDGMLASVQSTGQAANTASGVQCMESYIQGKKWDIILINFGIHGEHGVVVSRSARSSREWRCVADTWQHQYVPPKQYGANLQKIFEMGKAGLAPGGKLIWSSTTPIASNCTGCGEGTTTAHVVEYNAIALEVFHTVVAGTAIGVVNDLHAEVNRACGVNFTVCALQCYNNEHPSIPGAAFLGIKTAQTIAPFLNPREKSMVPAGGVRWTTMRTVVD